MNIYIFGGLPGSGAASSSGAWACILFYVFSAPDFGFIFLIPADGVSGLTPFLATLLGAAGAGQHPVPPPGPSPPAGDIATPGPILQELSDTTDDETKGKGKIKGKGQGGAKSKKDKSKDSES